MEAGKQGRAARQRGATLIEMMAAIGVIAILGAVAIPSFSSLRRSALRTTIVNDFIHSVHLARSEAIKRNAVISICRSSDGATCANGLPDWNVGWIVFENRDRDQPADTDPGEPVLYRRDALAGGTLTSNRRAFSFRPYNQGDVNGTLIYCAGPKEGRAIIISHTGRPRTSDRDANGKPVKC